MIQFDLQEKKPVDIGFSVSVRVGSSFDGYVIGDGLKLDPATNTLSVDAANKVEEDNTKPVTSAAVYTEVGNINALLASL